MLDGERRRLQPAQFENWLAEIPEQPATSLAKQLGAKVLQFAGQDSREVDLAFFGRIKQFGRLLSLRLRAPCAISEIVRDSRMVGCERCGGRPRNSTSSRPAVLPLLCSWPSGICSARRPASRDNEQKGTRTNEAAVAGDTK